MIAYAKKKGIKVISSTNGHLFGTIDQTDRLIASGLDTIIFAIDGISQETYQRYRQGGNLESALDGIRAMVERKRALHSLTPRINLRFIVMKHNEHGSGSVCPRTYDPREKYALGDIKNNSFKSIWLGAPYRRMRRQFRKSWDQLPLCRECSYAYKGGNCYNETILDAFFFDTEDYRQVIS
jgi:radical SAM protein with 4Fe4S-binding SPASM domain